MTGRTIRAGCFSAVLAWFYCTDSPAQVNSDVHSLLIESTFHEYKISEPDPPRPVFIHKKGSIAKISPLHYISSGLLFFYQTILSEQIQADCNYEISCSNYTKAGIEKFGLLKGVLGGFDQLTNCSVLILYDVPRYKISPRSKVNNSFETE